MLPFSSASAPPVIVTGTSVGKNKIQFIPEDSKNQFAIEYSEVGHGADDTYVNSSWNPITRLYWVPIKVKLEGKVTWILVRKSDLERTTEEGGLGLADLDVNYYSAKHMLANLVAEKVDKLRVIVQKKNEEEKKSVQEAQNKAMMPKEKNDFLQGTLVNTIRSLPKDLNVQLLKIEADLKSLPLETKADILRLNEIEQSLKKLAPNEIKQTVVHPLIKEIFRLVNLINLELNTNTAQFVNSIRWTNNPDPIKNELDKARYRKNMLVSIISTTKRRLNELETNLNSLEKSK